MIHLSLLAYTNLPASYLMISGMIRRSWVKIIEDVRWQLNRYVVWIRSARILKKDMDEGYNKELPQHLKIARGEARESRGRYGRCKRLLPLPVIEQRTSVLNQIIGGLTKTIDTLEKKNKGTSNV